MSIERGRQDRIFIYEDDTALATEVVAACALEGLVVEKVASELDLLDLARETPNAVFIMDRMVDGIDSLTIISRLRESGSQVPVLVISSKATVDDRICGLKSGGDDYLVKPFAMGELIARIEALHRRVAVNERQTSLTVGTLSIDLLDRTVRRGDRLIALLPREFGLLEYLMRHAGQTVTRAMLLEDVWNYRMPIQTNVIDVHIGNLRRKIDTDGEQKMIESVRGVGFKLIDAS